MDMRVGARTARPKAVQYVRMSTDMQKYSTENQIAAIAVYAAHHNLDIIRTYIDAGRSGLTIKSRSGLQQLIKDVRSDRPGFDIILVYDVSRWGRFQDADESAYYEFICREAGMSIRYCAEEFENDGSLGATITKAIKRAMAAEYSRELSNRVFAGKCRITMRGFHAGGRAAYGLRRMLVDERGAAKSLLQDGERKFLHTDRTVLVPGPAEEVETVRCIFDQFVHQRMSIARIVRGLNDRGILNANRKRWQKVAVHTVLNNEKYIGNSIFNRSSIRLKSKRVNVPQDRWIRAKGAFEPIIEETVFLAAQARLTCNLHRFNKFDLLDHLTAVWCKDGKLSSWQLDHFPLCPGHTTFRRVFGSVLEAFEAVGYRHCNQRPIYGSIERSVIEAVAADVIAAGGTAERAGRRRRQNIVLIDDTITVSIHLVHGRFKNYRGRSRWKIPCGAHHASDLTILAPYDKKSQRILTYYVVPGFLLAHPRPFLFDVNPIEFEAFRTDTLKPIISLLCGDYSSGPERACPPASLSFAPRHALRFPARERPPASAALLRSFERRSRRVASFVATCERFIKAEQTFRRDWASVLSDKALFDLLGDENLEALTRFWREELRHLDNDSGAAYKIVPHAPSDASGVRELLNYLTLQRLHQIQQMRAAFADSSLTFLKLLIAASVPDEFRLGTPKLAALTRGEAMTVRERFRPIEDCARSILPVFAGLAYRYALTRAYIRKLQSNDRVLGYLGTVHPRVLRRLISMPVAPRQRTVVYRAP